MFENIGRVDLLSESIRDGVGESPVWDDRTNTLYWVDITGRCIRAFAAGARSVESYQTEDFPTAVGLCEQPDKLIVALAGGVKLFDLTDRTMSQFVTIEDEPSDNRLNEGVVGPDGAFWVGTMQTNLNPDGSMRRMNRESGAFYRVGADRSVRKVTDQTFGITNTLAWDEARGKFYLGDTLKKTLYALPWPLPPGRTPQPEIHNQTFDFGFPDGSCLDNEGYLWNARYAGGCLVRIAPSGDIDAKVDLPATNITACCFGGEDLATLFVTTATNELTEEQMKRPAEGAVLALELGVSGRKAYRFGSKPYPA